MVNETVQIYLNEINRLKSLKKDSLNLNIWDKEIAICEDQIKLIKST